MDKKPKIIIPSSGRRGVHTTPFLDWAREYGATFPGHVSKKELVRIFSQSKMAVFLGAHGQNDRGPLEALSSGCPVIIGSPTYHTPALYKMSSNHACCLLGVNAVDRYELIAMHIEKFLSNADNCSDPYQRKKRIANEFKSLLGFGNSYSDMAKLLLLISNLPPERRFKESTMQMLQRIQKGE
jgi:hypothetical protein